MAWAGWGAGPSGAGASGGPGKVFLAGALAFSALVMVVLGSQRRFAPAGIAALGVVYFALRLFAGLGRQR